MKVEELIKAYNKAENKELAIKEIAREAKITRNGVVKFLRQYGIQIPKGVVIVEEWEEEGYIEKERDSVISEEEEEERDVMSSMAIEKYWNERWENLGDVERAMLMHTYLLKKYSLNSFGIYIMSMEYIIKKGTQKGLTEHLDKVMSVKPFTKKKETNITDILLGSVENMLVELTEPEAEPEKVIDEKPLLVRVFEAYNMLKNPEKYKFEQLRKKEAKKKALYQEGLEILKETLG